MPYIPVPIDTDPTDIAEDAFTYLEEQIAGWLPSPGNLDAWLVEALAQFAGELRDLVALVPDAIFEYFGESILALPPYPASAAGGSTTWTAIDAAGYTVDAGTLVAITPPAATDTYAFAVVAAFTIPAGQTTRAGVAVQAIEPGAAASGITGDVAAIDTLDFIQSITLDAPTSGGTDAEATDAYLSRLSDLLTLLSPRPILPQDFAILAQRSIAAVGRATAIDLYNPGPPINANCPRCVTVAVCDAVGNALSANVKSEVDALLQAAREVNFLVFVADPTYTQIDVTFDVTSYPGYDPALVLANVTAALNAYLSPANWGVPPYGDTSGRSWLNQTTVRYLEISTVINNTEGVNYLKMPTFKIGVHGGALGTADIVMPGSAAMPKPGTMTGTCVPG